MNEDALDPKCQKVEAEAERKGIQERMDPAWLREWSHTFAI